MKTRLCTPCFALVEPSRLLRFACLLCLPDIRHFLPNGSVLGVRVGHGLAGGEGGVKGVLVRARARALSPDPDLPPSSIQSLKTPLPTHIRIRLRWSSCSTSLGRWTQGQEFHQTPDLRAS